uniref:FAD-binding and (Fe-S)-binding domain-containing protein n=1 Tax=Sphingomonas bacterium TaxID=1895847 RepID=UPI002623F103|nr:FAD-binding and (Fe-S)-binding domain-containing protein [Sphingomonas bacterium]
MDMTPDRYDDVYRQLAGVIPSLRLITDPLRTLAYGTDASFYRLIPRIVVLVESEAEVRHLLSVARMHATPITFRAAGTSLSGQAISDSILMVLGDGWRKSEVAADGATIRLQPGVIGSTANRLLARHGRKIGPDPASIATAKIGGIAANNASGMCCGTAQNSYHTLVAMRLILADGTLLDTGDPESRAAFARSHGALLERLRQMGEAVRANAVLAERIARKFSIKNTTGYALNALVDFTDPVDMLQHLMIGSEGTLGFIAEVTLATVPDARFKASALLLFRDVAAAARAVAALKTTPVAAAELMDRASLRAVEGKPGIPPNIGKLGSDVAALLVETRADDATTLAAQIETLTAALAGHDAIAPILFDSDPAITDAYWKIRKGLFPAVGAMRRPGTTVIIEDVAFPVEHLASAASALQRLFDIHGYDEAILFGHALEGNLHFVFTQDFSSPEEVERYRRFMDDVVSMVVGRFDGSLKAEHGTGRNMAPFVEREWGPLAYALMEEIKAVIDPGALLNPGVILNRDPRAHVKHLKPLPVTDPLVDQCMECGFCEPSCPSHGFTLSPRQRIVGQREIARRHVSGEDAAEFERLFAYAGVDTCAACGLCATACPVGIETGLLMKQNRGEQCGPLTRRTGDAIAGHMDMTMTAVRAGFGVADAAGRLVGRERLHRLAAGARRLSGNRMPQMPRNLPRRARFDAAALPGPEMPIPDAPRQESLLYLPSCVSRAMGPAAGDADPRALPDVVRSLAERAGLAVRYPARADTLCCGMPWESKGLTETADAKADEMLDAMADDIGEAGAILMDTSPCAFRLRRRIAASGRSLAVLDIADFLHDLVLPRVNLAPVDVPVMLHVTCSSRRMGLDAKLVAVARACASQVVMPDDVGCCGFAGDKGFTTPELNDYALRHLAEAVPKGCGGGYSTSRTCEIGLADHAGISYRSIAYLVDEAIRNAMPQPTTKPRQ